MTVIREKKIDSLSQNREDLNLGVQTRQQERSVRKGVLKAKTPSASNWGVTDRGSFLGRNYFLPELILENREGILQGGVHSNSKVVPRRVLWPGIGFDAQANRGGSLRVMLPCPNPDFWSDRHCWCFTSLKDRPELCRGELVLSGAKERICNNPVMSSHL